MSTKVIPASELREGYTVILEGSAREIVGITAENIGDDINPIVRMWVDLGDDVVRLFDAGTPVTVVTEEGEF